MNDNQSTATPADVENTLIESQDSQSTLDYFRAYLNRIRSGDIGALPIVIGLIIIAVIFQSLNENYLTPRNFVNLIVQMAGITTIATGVVFALLLGEIDLSISYVSAVAAVLMTILLLEPDGWPWYAAIGVALLAGASIGFVQGLIITKFQVPSFVVTLAGFLVWNGVVLILIGGGGTVIIQDPVVIGIANYFLPEVWGWVVAGIAVTWFTLGQIFRVQSRRKRGVSTRPLSIVALQIIGVIAIAAIVVYVANQDRGVPMVGVILLILLAGFTYLATRTPFGRYVYAVGGNMEAARRAGINVDRIKVLSFMIVSGMAAFGGIVLASRLRSVDTAAGGGNLLLNSIAAAVIGGTSLFGGRGHVTSALYGALVIASVENGMGLLGLSSGVKFVVTGLVLLAAVLVDAISRRSRAQSGLA